MGVLSGEPQGSALGPLLLLVYINDLDSNMVNWVLKFADDTKLYSKVNRSNSNSDLQKYF